MDWSAWVPAIISLCTGLLIMGGYLSVVRDHGKRLDANDMHHRDIEKHDALQDIAITKLEAWRDGYNAARVVYGRAFEKMHDDEEI